ncbi:hypothetical protein [Phytohabitans aurantiacus]|uniref:Peptidase M48 domain-containing protein n=1 Tax=Phytohabitans aurantiacus TaxID=3016789 RepID=A0ABQ5R3L1_9ACTN|nr:hypothetical protein [Phytohabitans aurantiacus]GLI01306.1 hypothetical protein Pa4123_65820 [Phytohabitans aurantiacus]
MKLTRRRRVVVWVAGVLVAVLAAATGALAYAYPSVAATTCPRCYGLVPLRDGLYAERGLSEARRQEIVALYTEANARVAAFYGARASSPTILACDTTECYSRIGGGGERGVAVLNRAVMLSPRGLDAVIAAHEMSHVELHQRLDAGHVPQWFDEGLAVLVSGDERYLLPDTGGDRCRLTSQEALPETLDEWLRAASSDEQVYAKAACRVSRYVDASGGPQAILTLIDSLNHDAPFPAITP